MLAICKLVVQEHTTLSCPLGKAADTCRAAARLTSLFPALSARCQSCCWPPPASCVYHGLCSDPLRSETSLRGDTHQEVFFEVDKVTRTCQTRGGTGTCTAYNIRTVHPPLKLHSNDAIGADVPKKDDLRGLLTGCALAVPADLHPHRAATVLRIPSCAFISAALSFSVQNLWSASWW